MITTKVIVDDAEIRVKHNTISDASCYRNKGLFIEASSTENNTLSTITFNDCLDIYIFWESFTSATSLEVLYVPETGVMFIGAGTVSARINTKDRSLLDLVDICLFWGLIATSKNMCLKLGS